MAVSIEEFAKALKALEEVLQLPKSDVVRDAAIQRFEFAVDLSWKTCRKLIGVGPIVPTGDMSNVGLMIGTSGNPSSGREESFNGYLAELIVFNKKLSPVERARFREYTTNKWGVTVPEITFSVP